MRTSRRTFMGILSSFGLGATAQGMPEKYERVEIEWDCHVRNGVALTERGRHDLRFYNTGLLHLCTADVGIAKMEVIQDKDWLPSEKHSGFVTWTVWGPTRKHNHADTLEAAKADCETHVRSMVSKARRIFG